MLAGLGIEVAPEVTFRPAHEIFTPRAGVVAATDIPNVAATTNVDLARSGYAAFAAGDIPGVLAFDGRRPRVDHPREHQLRRGLPRAAGSR